MNIQDIRRGEIYRYLGYLKGAENLPALDDQTRKITEELIASLWEIITPKSVYKEFALALDGEHIVIGEGAYCIDTHSHSLSLNLAECKKVVLFAATLGSAADMAVRRYKVMGMAQAAIAQAVLSEMIEVYCNEVNVEIAEKYKAEGLTPRPRFSAGYGDFSLGHQVDFFRMLDLTRRLGLELNQQMLMTPTKSVTAVIGLR